MRYLVALIAGIWIGLAFNRLPHCPLFKDQPGTPSDWVPKMRGAWTDEEQQVMNRYFNGGKN